MVFEIWKFPLAQTFLPLSTNKIDIITMPAKAEVVHTAYQKDNGICIWALVDPDQEAKEQRKFYTLATGEPIAIDTKFKALSYIGTVNIAAYTLVYHIFEEIERFTFSDNTWQDIPTTTMT